MTAFGPLALAFVCSTGTAVAQVAHHIAAANITVVQNDTGNTSSSVTVTTALAINDFRIRSGSNRADYDVQIGDASTDDVANGILISSIDQNGRDNGEETNFPGMNYGTSAIDSNASSSPGSSGEYWIPVFQAPSDSEYNFNVAAAYFPYAYGWYGGWLNNASGVNGGANNHLIGHPSLVLGTHVIDLGGGKTTVDLRPFGLDSRSNAVLLAVGGKNEANFALSGANTNGTWTVYCHDDNGSYEQDYIGFVCVPLTNHTVVSGKFLGNASIAMQSAPLNVTVTGNGTYHLTIPGVNPANGVLIVSPEGGGANNGDNIVSYQLNGDGWDIQTRDITAGFTPALQNLPDTDAVASFVYIPGPTPGSTNLIWTGTAANTWDLSGSNVWKLADSNTPASYLDGSQTVFNDSAANFLVNLGAVVTPYAVTVSNVANSYFLGGTGSIVGVTGLLKQGAGTLILAESNGYAGDTVIAQGTLSLGTAGALPGGPGYGNVTVNGTLDLAGFSPAINNLSGNGTVDNAAPGAVNLSVVETTNTTFAGGLKNTAGSVALSVSGGGILTLTGANTISGLCTVSNATLMVNGSLRSNGVAILAGAGLGGTGAISGPVALAGGSMLVLKANVPLTAGPLTLNGAVRVTVDGNYSLINAGTYVLLKHGATNGPGQFVLTPPVGLQCYGFTAALQDTGAQLQLVVSPAGVTGSIADVRHVVILMNENRSFDHYFGSFHNVRGFNDRNALVFTNQNSDFYQPTSPGYELPFHTSIQCISDLNHTWPVTHSTVDGGKNDGWIANKTPPTMAFMNRSDLPFYYALADAYTICDEYHCSVLSSTYPNRLSLMTGMIDPTGSGGGPEIDNSEPANGFHWLTYPEMLQQGGVSWKIYQVAGNNSDNVLQLFASFQQAKSGNPLHDRGMVASANLTDMVTAFQTDVANNTLPSVSWIIGPDDYTEHPPWSPANGQVLTKQLLDAVAANPAIYNSTVFIVNYDENDGFFDHAMPILPPGVTTNDYVGGLPIGLGIRVPCIIVSPWTRGGRVCSQVFDHTSIIRLLENWTGVADPNISAWRRQVCGDLTSAFDFAHPNTNYPALPTVSGITCGSGTTPTVPSSQTFPTQESGSIIWLPLPYQPEAACVLNTNANTLGITMTNSGTASVHFAIYPEAYRNDGPWASDVPAGTTAGNTFSLSASGGRYDFSCYGPNGFQRRFAGNINQDFQQIEAMPFLNPAIAGLKVELVNASASAVTFTVTNGYVAGSPAYYVVPAHGTNVVNVFSETNNGFYDVTVMASSDTSFLRRFLGRVEVKTGLAPMISSKNPSILDDTVTFTASFGGYGTPTGTVQFRTNGIAAGGPVPLINGSAAISAAAFACGGNVVTAEYSGDLLNGALTNTLTQIVSPPPPIITLYGPNPLTNWLGTTFADPGVLAIDRCAGLLAVTTNGAVNSLSAGTYFIQYTAGVPPDHSATNIRTVQVLAETAPVVSGAGLLGGTNFQFNFGGPAGQPYKILTTSNLAAPGVWSVLYTGILGTLPSTLADTNVSGTPARFYRVVSP